MCLDDCLCESGRPGDCIIAAGMVSYAGPFTLLDAYFLSICLLFCLREDV